MSQITKQNNMSLDYKEITKFEELLAKLKKYIKDKKELELIKKAYDFSAQCHKTQTRKNGDPYIYHPLSTAYYLAQW
ncbi:Bifunctional (p)ppGpp synthase/hydrolase relA, partial [Mycoplasma putrefaciens]